MVETTMLAILVVGIVVLGGFIKGLAGFGYALVGTAILATIMEPTRAVVVMILPMLAADVSLVNELDGETLRSCIVRFWPYLVMALVGTAIGMVLLETIPARPLRLALGGLTLGYVVLRQPWWTIPGLGWFRGRCFRPSRSAQAALGMISGFVFGGTNVGVQMVAYLEYLQLSRSTFVGVLAMIMVGISTLRVGIAGVLGLYGTGSVLLLSLLAVVPGLLGVFVGSRLRHRTPERTMVPIVMILLAVVGLRLLVGGLLGM